MVRLTRIYTRGGDAGETSLGDGARVPKHVLRVVAYGTIDEANATIGIARLYTEAAADEMRQELPKLYPYRKDAAVRILPNYTLDVQRIIG